MGTTNAVADAELERLSDEERAALADDEGEDLEALKDIADSDETDTAGEEDNAEGAQDDADADGAEAGSEDDSDDEPEDAASAEFVPAYRVDPVEDFDKQISDLATEKKGLREKLNEGELTLDEYEEQKDAIVAKEQALREQNLKATIAAEQNQQNAQSRWQWEQEQFFNQEANKMYATNKLLMSAMDTAVKELANDPKNVNQSAAWFLREADKQVRAAFGQPKVETKLETKPRKPDLSAVPKTLAELPSAELPETSGDEFAGLEKLSGMELEREIARRSKSDPTFERRYLQAA